MVAETGSKSVSCSLDQPADVHNFQLSCSNRPLLMVPVVPLVSTMSAVFAAEYFEDRTDVQCLHRWQKVLNPELVKGPWTKEVR